MLAKLLRTIAREIQHVFLAAEVQASRRTRFDACRFEPFAHAVRAQRALEDTIGLGVHFWNVERASRDAVAAANTVGLLKIDDAVGVLHDSPVRGTCRQDRKSTRLNSSH